MTLHSRLLDLAKSVDAVLAPALGRRWVRGGARNIPDDPQDVLVVRLWGLGNLALLVPHLAAARGRRLRLLTLERNVPFVQQQVPWVETLAVPEPTAPAFLPRVLAVARDVSRRPPDVVVDLESFLRLPLVLARGAGRAPAVGLDPPGQGRAALLTRAVAHDPTRHVADTFAAVWRAAGLPVGAGPGPLSIAPADRRRIRERLGDHSRPLVVVHPGSGDHFPGRRWPPERFGELAHRLAVEFGATIVLTGNRAERRLVALVRAAAAGRARDWSGTLDTGSLVALLSAADLVVTNDTGPLHLADAVDTASVALYGPNTPHRYGPRRAGSTALFADLPCSPCLDDRTMKRSSCRRFDCMTALTVDVTAAACRRALVRQPTDGLHRAREAPHVLPR